MIFGINEDGVVGTCRHTGFAADTNRFVEIDNAVGALEHRRRRAGSDAWRMRALIAPRHLMRATHLRKHANIYVLDIGAGYADWDDVFRFACGGAGMTADAAGVID